MRLSSIVFPVVGACTGLGLAVLGFQASSATTATHSDPTDTDVPAVGRPLPVAPAQVSHHWAACAHHAHLVHGVCVTVVHRSVTVYDSSPSVSVPVQGSDDGQETGQAPAAQSPRPQRHSSRHEHEQSEAGEAEHEGEHEAEHETEHEDDTGSADPSEPTQSEMDD